MKGFIVIIKILLTLAAIAGMLMCGINIINSIFDKDSSYVMAISGFLMMTICGIVCNFELKA